MKDADIILLQEMGCLSVKTIAGHVEYNYVYYRPVIHNSQQKQFGNARARNNKEASDDLPIWIELEVDEKRQ